MTLNGFYAEDLSGRPKRDVVLVHSSDLHIGDEETVRIGQGDAVWALSAVLNVAGRLNADVVVLAGDVFDHNRLPAPILDRTARVVADAGIPVVILPGNHDPVTPDSAYRRGGLGDVPDVHILGLTSRSAASFPALGLEVWGHAHRNYEDMVPLRAPRPRSTRWQVAVAHGHYEPVPNRRVRPRPAWLIGDREITATGADYIALGHWNRPAAVGTGKIPAFYSGSPELAGTVNVVRFAAQGAVTVECVPIAE